MDVYTQVAIVLLAIAALLIGAVVGYMYGRWL